jgi:Ser/Thr protein kinase RdoA (MazF antagonist)
VNGLLDFELAGTDYRVQDLVAALLLSGALEGPDWHRRVAALVRGHVYALGLDPAEVQAVPDLLLCRGLGSVLHRAARWRRGQATLADVAARLGKLDATIGWLAACGEDLLDVLAPLAPLAPFPELGVAGGEAIVAILPPTGWCSPGSRAPDGLTQPYPSVPSWSLA